MSKGNNSNNIATKNCSTKCKEKGKVQIKHGKLKTITHHEGTGNRQEHEQEQEQTDANRSNDQTKSSGKTQTKYTNTNDKTKNR